MRTRALLVLVFALVASSLLATNATAASHRHGKYREVKKILRDCQDGKLKHKYSLKALKRALKTMPDDIRYYTPCEKVIKRAIRKAKRQLKREVRRIYRDCAKDDHLEGHYSLAALKLALKRLPDDLRDYTGCERAIKRAIRHYKKHHRPHGHHRAGTTAARLRTT